MCVRKKSHMASTWPKAASSTLLLSPIYVSNEFNNNNNVTSPEPKFDQAQNQLQTAIFMVPKFIRPFFLVQNTHFWGIPSVCQCVSKYAPKTSLRESKEKFCLK